jgi:hypothetical protein
VNRTNAATLNHQQYERRDLFKYVLILGAPLRTLIRRAGGKRTLTRIWYKALGSATRSWLSYAGEMSECLESRACLTPMNDLILATPPSVRVIRTRNGQKRNEHISPGLACEIARRRGYTAGAEPLKTHKESSGTRGSVLPVRNEAGGGPGTLSRADLLYMNFQSSHPTR